jgi:hypothetical protein
MLFKKGDFYHLKLYEMFSNKLQYGLHSFESCTIATMTWFTAMKYLCHKWPRIYSTCRNHSFPHSWLLTGFASRLTRRLPLVEQELLTLPELLSSTPVFSGIRVTRSLVLWVCFVDRCLPFLATVLSVLRFTDSDYTFGIFKLLLYKACRIASVWRNFHFVVLCVFIQEIIHGIHSLFQRF